MSNNLQVPTKINLLFIYPLQKIILYDVGNYVHYIDLLEHKI